MSTQGRFQTLKLVLLISFITLSLSSCDEYKNVAITSPEEDTNQENPTQLQVTFTSPSGSVEGAEETIKILVGFNQPMTPLQAVPREEPDGPLEIQPPLKGRYRWLGTRVLSFIPDEPLQPATTYWVILKKDRIKSLSNKQLDADFPWKLMSVRPDLIDSLPAHNSQFIDLKGKIYLQFNLEMSPEQVGDKIKIRATPGCPSEVWCCKKTPSPQKAEDVAFTIRNLSDEEKKGYPLKDWANNKTLVLVPENPLPIESQIEVEIQPGLLARVGDLGTSLNKKLTFNTYNTFSLLKYPTEIPGGMPLELCFSNEVSFNEIVKNMTIEPEVEIPKDYLEDTDTFHQAEFYLPFRLNTGHKIRIDANLKDIYGNRLDKPYEFTLKVGDYLPHVSMPTGINILESLASLRFPVNFRNVDNVELEMGLLDLDNVISFLKQPDIFNSSVKYKSPGFFKVSKTWKVNTCKDFRNRIIPLPIKTKNVLGKKQNGLIYVQLDTLGQNKDGPGYLKAFIQATDLGLTWKFSPENNLVWVTSLHSGNPVKGANIQFRDDDNHILAKGITDNSGLCEIKGWAQAGLKEKWEADERENEYEMESYQCGDEPNFWISASKDGDSSIYSKNWDFGIQLWRFDIPYNWAVRAEEYDLYTFTEKGLYRSGETVHVKGIARKKKKGRWVIPDSLDLGRIAFVVKNSRDEEIVKEDLPLNSTGAFFKDINLPQDAPCGVYSIYLSLPGKRQYFYHSFRVEAFRPAEFEVKVSSERDIFLSGETFSGKILSKYLFGMPMKDADLKWNLQREKHCVEFPQYQDYSFGGSSGDKEEDDSQTLGSGKGQLDDKGEYRVELPLSLKEPSVITLEGEVASPNKRSICGRQNWLAYPSNLLIGLKTSQYLYTLGSNVRLDILTIRPNGERVADKGVALTLVKQEWKSIKKAMTGGRYEWVSELVEKEVRSCAATSCLDAVSIDFLPDEPGEYYIRAESRDEDGRKTITRIYFYVTGRGEAGWEMSDDDRIELVPDKKMYHPGDTARIMVKSPYDSAQALVTVERELVLRKFTKRLQGNADYIDLPIKSIDLPNVYVSVVLIQGRREGAGWDREKGEDTGKPQFKIGYLNLRVDREEKHLMIKTKSDKEEYRPRERVTVSYEVKDYKGRPVSNSEVALFVVDVGVLNLIDFKTPDPFEYFYGPRPLSVKTVESRINIVGERNYGEKGEERGGSGAYGGIKYREKFLSTVYYKGDLSTDSNGRGRVSFELPDNLTKFRIMVVAQTENSEFGRAESNFVVNLPFIATGSIPRFARVGDRFKAGVVLHNRTEQAGTAGVECQIQGLSLIGEERKTVVIPPNSSREVLFSFEASKIGSATFSFKAGMGRESDALRITIPVKSPPFIEAVATFASIKDAATETIIVPANSYPDTGGLEISLSPSIMSGMQRGIEHLLEYPYGCLEQRLSKILPLIVGEELINQFRLCPVRGAKLRTTVQSVLDEIPEYQAANGGFLYYRDCHHPSPYLSAYTMYVLYRAKLDGYRIKPEVIEKGKGFLKEVLRWNDTDWTYPYNENERLLTNAFCIYSLAIWGQKETGYASRLFDQRNQIPVFGKVLLLKAGRQLDMGKHFEREMVRMITNKLKFSPTTAHFEESELRGGWTHPSPAKVTGFVIQSFTELDIPFPYKDQVLCWLVQERKKGTKPTTHENAFVFDALQTYYKKYEREKPDFAARVILGEKEILNRTFKGRTNNPPERYHFGLEDIPRDRQVPIKITKEGQGRLYYTLRMIYALKDSPIAFDEGFYVWKEILTLEGKKVEDFKRGEVYKVILHIVTPQTRLFAVVEDPLPAGFEPVQTSFATESRQREEQFERAKSENKGHWWGSFDHEEYYDDRVIFSGQQLFPGEHTRVYFVRAGTNGRFLSPAAKAEEMYSPEVFGSTPQGYVSVGE